MSKLLILDGREKLEMWWVEEGYLTDLSSVLLVRTCLGPPWLACCLVLQQLQHQSMSWVSMC